MTIYPRPDEKVFAENALAGEIQDFPDILRGWGVTFDQTDGFPPMEWFNALARRQDEAIRYLIQHGIPEWSPTEQYPAGAYVQEDGRTWKSSAANAGMRPSTTPASWSSWGLNAADLQNAYSTFSTDTGTANTVVAAFWPAITALADGMQLRVKVKSTNTGATTLKCNDLPARAIVGLAGSALQGGELVASGRATLMYSATRDSFVLLSCEGAAQSQSGLPLLFPLWCPNRAAIPAGYAPADGQTLSRSLYPDAWAGIAAGNVPVATDTAWLATPTERGKFTAGDGSTTFRLPDYNGKSAGSLGALFMRGDGALSAGTDGEIQPDAFQGHWHRYGNGGGAGTQFTTQNPTGALASQDSRAFAYDPLSDGVHGSPRTAAETRSLNATGCWVIRLFGAVVNPGAADAAQLATEVSKLGSDKVPFTAFLGANQSLASSGYQKQPGGLILQWGVLATPGVNTTMPVTFPVSFPAACRFVGLSGIAGTIVGGSDGGCYATSLTSAGFGLVNGWDGGINPATVYWFAIGY